MRKRSCFNVLALVLLVVFAVPAYAYDSEWPPVADPPWSPPHPDLVMGEMTVNVPTEIGDWFNHTHDVGWSNHAVAFTVGDIEGADDGDLGLVAYMANEVLAGFAIDIDWEAATPTMTATLLWAWMSPYAARPSTSLHGGLGGVAPGSNDEHLGWAPSKPVIYDLDGDGYNEVAFVYDDDPETIRKSDHEGGTYRTIRVVQTDPAASGPGPNFSVPEPKLLASCGQIGSAWIMDRLGLIKVRDGGHDLITHGHQGVSINILQLTQSGGVYSLAPIYYRRDCCDKSAHEWNYVDLDGDGYDECVMSGVVDFVDATGPTNGVSGIRRWQAYYPGWNGHIDFLKAADHDPNHAGYEILAAPESAWKDWMGVDHPGGYPVMFDADGAILFDNTNAPATHDQSICTGNWTSTEDGLESMFWPKGAGVAPPGQLSFDGGFAQDALGNELASDGLMMQDGKWRCGGPADGVEQIDWDGDYTQDEMLDGTGACVYIWRMGEKGDWGATPPAGMPANSTIANTSWLENGTYYSWWWYKPPLGVAASVPFENGGAGPFTHYYEKLGEAKSTAYWRYAQGAYDMGRDYREEMILFHWKNITVFYNTDALAEPLKYYSPTLDPEYCRFRQEVHSGAEPYDYASRATLLSIEVTPKTISIPLNSTVQLMAIGKYSDGTEVDLTEKLYWQTDPNLMGIITVDQDGLVSSNAWETSGRFCALALVDGAWLKSNNVYVYTTNSPVPAILSAGYTDTYLVEGDQTRLMKVEARVAQRDNLPQLVAMFNADSSPWMPNAAYVILEDNGLNGDEEIGDGVYTAIVDPPPQDASPGVDLHDNLKVIHAAWYDPTMNGGAGGWQISNAWPYYAVGGPPAYIDISNNNDMDQYYDILVPKVKTCGFRGFNVVPQSDWLFMEVEVIMPDPYVPTAFGVYAWLPWMTPPNDLVQLTQSALDDDLYTISMPLVPNATAPNGTHIIDVAAVCNYGWLEYSDFWPRFNLHATAP